MHHFARVGTCGPARGEKEVGEVFGLTPSGFVSNSLRTRRGGRSECRAADVVRMPLTPYRGAAVELHPRVQLALPRGAALASCTRCWANQANVLKPFSAETEFLI